MVQLMLSIPLDIQIRELQTTMDLLTRQMESNMMEEVRDVSSYVMAWMAGVEQDCFAHVQQSVSQTRTKPFYTKVQQSGVCKEECLVLDNFEGLCATLQCAT